MNPTMTKSMTAPIVALTTEPTKPANGTNRHEPQLREQPDADEGAHDADDDVPEESEAKTAHDLPGQPAGDRTDDQHDDNAVYSNHDVLPTRPGTSVPPPFCDAT